MSGEERCDADLLRRTGEALYGPQWQAALAREHRMSERHMRRLAAGTHPVPSGLWSELAEHVAERMEDLQTLVSVLGGEVKDHLPTSA